MLPLDINRNDTKLNTHRVLCTEEPTAGKVVTPISPLKKFSNAANVIWLIFSGLR
jgi:hypothetical protein